VVQTLLAAHGLSPRKVFGQNFMVDSNFAAAIARDARADAQTLLLEVGPGTGILTRALLESHPAAHVLAIEIDRGLAQLLRESLAAEMARQRFTLIEGDALAGKHRVAQEWLAAAHDIMRREGRTRAVLCANLPYNIATPLLANFAGGTTGLDLERALVTIQLELAQRLTAAPDSENYGALSAFLAQRADGSVLRRVGGEVFWPRPNVESAVLELRFKAWSETGAGLRRAEAEPFQAFLRQVFAQRRKTLRAILKPRIVPAIPGVTPDSRAEALAPEQLLAVHRALEGVENRNEDSL
jgi:16S rRNA (adenine1518-N6/adenine1519-N6)-dimethyltransferase